MCHHNLIFEFHSMPRLCLIFGIDTLRCAGTVCVRGVLMNLRSALSVQAIKTDKALSSMPGHAFRTKIFTKHSVQQQLLPLLQRCGCLCAASVSSL